MKNVSLMLVNMFLNTTAHSTIPKFDNHPVHRQPKLYGPLLGVLLANLLSKAAVAKYAPLGALRLSYDPNPWLAYNKPVHTYEPQDNYHNSYWYPIKNPFTYGPPHFQTITTEPSHFHHHHHIENPPNQQQIVHIHDPPVEVTIEDNYHDLQEQQTLHPPIVTNIESPQDVQEPEFSESNVRFQRLPPPKRKKITTLKPKKSVKRGTPSRYVSIKRNKYSSKRRPYTTPDYYYDSYEDYTTTNRYKSKRKTKPRRPVDSYEYEYEDNDDEYSSEAYDSFERTTRPYKKRRRPTQKPQNRIRNKNKKRQEITALDDDDYDYDSLTPSVQIRPRQQTTTDSTTTDATSTTIITNGTTPSNPGNSTNSTGFGYGPSNGNEGISITYGPPHGGYEQPHPSYGPPQPSYGPPMQGQYQVPFSDWYSHEATRNAIVKKVQDLIGFDNVFQN